MYIEPYYNKSCEVEHCITCNSYINWKCGHSWGTNQIGGWCCYNAHCKLCNPSLSNQVYTVITNSVSKDDAILSALQRIEALLQEVVNKQ